MLRSGLLSCKGVPRCFSLPLRFKACSLALQLQPGGCASKSRQWVCGTDTAKLRGNADIRPAADSCYNSVIFIFIFIFKVQTKRIMELHDKISACLYSILFYLIIFTRKEGRGNAAFYLYLSYNFTVKNRGRFTKNWRQMSPPHGAKLKYL